MTVEQLTLGQAIDQVIAALEPLDPNARQTVLTAVTTHLGLATSVVAPPAGGATSPSGNQRTTSTKSPPVERQTPKSPKIYIDIRAFKEQKQPESANQMACIVGFYLQELAPTGERQDTIETGDLEKYFKQAGYPLPSNVGQVLRNCKRAGYLESVSRGAFKLNAVGYNLVAHRLPKAKGSE
ncbi:MAG: hypothetical protein SWE60_06120 [Thermodesulfobacteriota bacterium]|nr:hypothetical protein [Thermodesulfobacteriota bacterium]